MPTNENGEEFVRSNDPMPKDYVFVPKGNVYITLHCRRLTKAANLPIYVVASSTTAKRKTLYGIRCPSHVHEEVLTSEASTRSNRNAAVVRKDTKLENKFRVELLKFFPKVPEGEVEGIVGHTLKKRAGRVGRAGGVDVEKSVRLAVWAWVRHGWTEYEKLLRGGMERQEARKKIDGKAREIVKEWAGGKEDGGFFKLGRKKKEKKKKKKRTVKADLGKNDVRKTKTKTKPMERTITGISIKGAAAKGANNNNNNAQKPLPSSPPPRPQRRRSLRLSELPALDEDSEVGEDFLSTPSETDTDREGDWTPSEEEDDDVIEIEDDSDIEDGLSANYDDDLSDDELSEAERSPPSLPQRGGGSARGRHQRSKPRKTSADKVLNGGISRASRGRNRGRGISRGKGRGRGRK